MTDERDPDEIVDDLDGPVLLFDGVCNLCNAAVRFTVRFDESGTFRFAPLQSDVGRALLGRHALSTDEFDSVVLVEGDDCYTRSTAALRVCRRLDGPWPLLYPLVFLPAVLRDPVYDLIATHRYRVFGRTDECQIPDPELRERFVERALDTV
ncbi:thiol-disulfide oxidoreductase DCC family protein (plasmid) [Haladaptatus sp. SPP-AMP-3]|uniref:thiol-disulfide oxidoreductase DCC family protein n=1 Tax=Haladaptatus sp. SPP-AMP-3 TaxID=3121295 RepID=UPI003C2E83CE